MATLARKTTIEAPASMYLNPNIDVQYELTIGEDVLKSGDKVKLKGDNRTLYTFRCLAHNIELDKTWVDLVGPEGFRSVRVEVLRLIKIVKKRSRARKPNSAVDSG